VDISFVIPVKDEEGTLRDLYKGIVENSPLNLSFEIIFICVNTPSKDKGEINLSQVISSAKSISKFLKNSRTSAKIREIFSKEEKKMEKITN